MNPRLNLRAATRLLALTLFVAAGSPQTPEQGNRYDAEAPKTIVELQQFRQASSIRTRGAKGREGTATLTNLNPSLNSWFVLRVAWDGSASDAAYHLENADRRRKLTLDPQAQALLITAFRDRYVCDLFGGDVLEKARSSSQIYSPLCDGRVYLRNTAAGHRSTLEAATEFLREHIWGGEKIIGLGHILMGDWNRETGELGTDHEIGSNGASHDFPQPAAVDSKYADRVLQSGNLGIETEGGLGAHMKPGAWYPAKANFGVYVSLLQPDLIEPAMLQSYKTRVNTLDAVEAPALAYLIAFDLDRFDLGFALGTDHPKVGWSDHLAANVRNPALPGPDGIGSINPLVSTGMIAPPDTGRTIATFTGGFKRTHGAFKFGELAAKNHGSHYGFLEKGVLFSKLQPGLATVFVLDDGSVAMKSWTEADNQLLGRIAYARQNGVALIDYDGAAHGGAPAPLVNRWGEGNWSGSEAGKLRTMRAGLGLETNGRKRFLIYAVFSDATPSAMARVFQAYRCDYAMLLDMNALEHTYLALYRRSGAQFFVDHLLKGMSALEKSSDSGEIVPRFVGYADNRDFFYVMHK